MDKEGLTTIGSTNSIVESSTSELKENNKLETPNFKKKKFTDTLSPRNERKIPIKKRLKIKKETKLEQSSEFKQVPEPCSSKDLVYNISHFNVDTEHKTILMDFPTINMSHEELSMTDWDDVYNIHNENLSDGNLNSSWKSDNNHDSRSSENRQNLRVKHPESDELIDIEETGDALTLPSSLRKGTKVGVVDSSPIKKEDQSKNEESSSNLIKHNLVQCSNSRRNPGPKKTLVVRFKKEDVDSPTKGLFKRPRGEIVDETNNRKRKDKKKKSSKRSKKQEDTQLDLCNILEQVWKKMRDHHQSYPFMAPVQVKHAPDYYTVITKPMDLRTIHEKLVRYKSHREFLGDVKLMVKNCHLYNKNRNPELPRMADALYRVCKNSMKELRQEIFELEKKEVSKNSEPAVHLEESLLDLASSPLSSTIYEESEFVDIDDSFINNGNSSDTLPTQTEEKDDDVSYPDL